MWLHTQNHGEQHTHEKSRLSWRRSDPLWHNHSLVVYAQSHPFEKYYKIISLQTGIC